MRIELVEFSKDSEVKEEKVNEAECINKVNLQSLNSSVNRRVFGVNRSALVRPAKTLTDPRIWSYGIIQVFLEGIELRKMEIIVRTNTMVQKNWSKRI